MKKFIVVISNYRMFLLSRLILKETKLDDIFFIFDSSISKKLLLNIPTFMTTKRGKGNISLIFNTILFFIRYSFFKRKYKLDLLPVYGADHITGIGIILRKHEFNLIEDGTINYDYKSYKRSLKNRIFSIPKFGMCRNVKKIYLTKNISASNDIPSIIKAKVSIIDIKKIWNSLSNIQKSDILSLFGIDKYTMNSFFSKKYKYILFTQPLSEDGVISEREKVTIYSKIIKKYSNINTFIIKPHPREITNYQKEFSNTLVLPEQFPSELLYLLGIDFEKVITLFSTAVFNYSSEKVDFYGTSVHHKLLERFGNIEYNN